MTKREVPDEPTFSPAFATFDKKGLRNAVHEAILPTHLGEAIIEHAATDVTAIEAHAKAHSTADAAAIKAPNRAQGSVPIIDANKRNGTAPPPMEPGQRPPLPSAQQRRAEHLRPQRPTTAGAPCE